MVSFLVFTLIGCQSTSSESKKHESTHNRKDVLPVKTDRLPPQIAKELEGITESSIGFLAIHDIISGEPQLLLRDDGDYEILSGQEKEKFLSEPYETINTTRVSVKTVKKNPWCQIIVINGSIDVICRKI